MTRSGFATFAGSRAVFSQLRHVSLSKDFTLLMETERKMRFSCAPQQAAAAEACEEMLPSADLPLPTMVVCQAPPQWSAQANSQEEFWKVLWDLLTNPQSGW